MVCLSNSEGVVASKRSRGVRSACDRCYQLKERCERTSTSCKRCERLEQVCVTVRPVRPTGRPKPRRERPASHNGSRQSMIGAQSTHDICSWLGKISDLSLEEKELLMFLLGDPQALQDSVVSSRFKDAEQQSFVDPFISAWPILKDAYLVYASVLKSLHTGCATEADDDSNFRRTTSAMMLLRSLSVSKSEDVKLCLTLGFALASSVYATIGVGVSDICQYCLSITRPFIENGATNPETEPQINSLVLLETMECIVYRRKPTLRIQPPVPGTVDRHLGLSLPLLPYFHDLCVISHSLVNCIDTKPRSVLQQQLEVIQARVGNWQPSPPEGFIHQFSAAEVVLLLAQARVYRLAVLLMIHRLRHAFGEEDSQADLWSREVMTELELARQISNQPIRFVTVPFVIAAIEIQDPTERENALRDVDEYVDRFTPVVKKATKAFLSRIWQERDEHENFSWFDSVHKPCVAYDAIVGSFAS